MSSTSLTTHLSSLPLSRPYAAATTHPFLTAAGNLTLPRSRLALWLAQDRIYAAHGYPRFIALLIAKIPFDNAPKALDDRNRRILKVLVDCLTNIVREVGFFEETAEKWGLEIGDAGGEGRVWVERKATRDYTAEMARISSLGTLEDGLVFLWGMEKVYLDAWRYVKSLHSSTNAGTNGERTAAAIRDLTNSWATPEFETFVNETSSVMDECFKDLSGESRKEAFMRAEMIWNRVVELEETFWPEDGEENTARVPAK